MDKFLRLITPEVKSLVETQRTSEAIYALEETISWSLVQLSLIWATNFTNLRLAEEYLRMAIKLWPRSWQFHINLAHVLNLACKWEEAKEEALKAIAFSEGKIYEPFYNLGVILTNLGDHEGAISTYRAAMRLHNGTTPNQASYNISASLLALEQWDEGWTSYENRFEVFEKIKTIRNRFKKIYKRGEPTKGKKIYLFSEQGIGDLIQFARYIPKFRSRTGATLIVESQKACSQLIADNFGVEVNPREDGIWPEVPDVDYAFSICSLPGFFEAGIENIPSKPYIKAPIVKEMPDILKTDKLKVGICWAGNPDHANDMKRSVYLKDFAPLFKMEEIKLFSLQKDVDGSRVWWGKNVSLRKGLPECEVINLSSYLNDFSDTAYFIDQMDLVITVDTSIAHLAGAMGKPTWVLLDKHNDWRWGLKDDTSVWYPSFKFFRQEKLFEWTPVLQQVAQELTAFRTRQPDQKKSASCGKKGSVKRRSRKHSP